MKKETKLHVIYHILLWGSIFMALISHHLLSNNAVLVGSVTTIITFAGTIQAGKMYDRWHSLVHLGKEK